MLHIRIRNGYDITVGGAPRQAVGEGPRVRSVALLGEDYPGLRPVFAVEPGQRVAAGDRLFTDRRRPRVVYTAPVAGTVSDISQGPRRSLDSLVIAADGEDAREFPATAQPDRAASIALLLESGLWPAFRARPFGRVPDPDDVADALFVTATDTAPLAPDPAVVIARHAGWFTRGAGFLRGLTDGAVYICRAAGADIPPVEGTRAAAFSGPHPAGLPGTHIHHLHTVGGSGQVWHIGYQDVIAIGCLLETGRIWTRRVVSVAGPAIEDPGLRAVPPGANLRDVAAPAPPGAARYLSGSPLDGRPDHFLGRYHLQVTGMPHDDTGNAPHGGLLRRLRGLLASPQAPSAVVPNAAHEQVAPPGVLPIPFLRAISIGDFETARRLGALEFVEEDMALLGRLDGVDYGALLRRTLADLEAAR